MLAEGKRHDQLDGGVQRQLLDAESRARIVPALSQNLHKETRRPVEYLRLACEATRRGHEAFYAQQLS